MEESIKEYGFDREKGIWFIADIEERCKTDGRLLRIQEDRLYSVYPQYLSDYGLTEEDLNNLEQYPHKVVEAIQDNICPPPIKVGLVSYVDGRFQTFDHRCREFGVSEA